RCAVTSRSGRPEFIGGPISCAAIPLGALSRRHTKWMLSTLMLRFSGSRKLKSVVRLQAISRLLVVDFKPGGFVRRCLAAIKQDAIPLGGLATIMEWDSRGNQMCFETCQSCHGVIPFTKHSARGVIVGGHLQIQVPIAV